MRTTAPQGAESMGKSSVEFQVVNNGDLEMVHRGLMPPHKVRRQTIAGVVDPGAAMLVKVHNIYGPSWRRARIADPERVLDCSRLKTS